MRKVVKGNVELKIGQGKMKTRKKGADESLVAPDTSYLTYSRYKFEVYSKEEDLDLIADVDREKDSMNPANRIVHYCLEQLENRNSPTDSPI